LSLLADGVKMGEGWVFDNREYVEETGEEMIELKPCAHCGHKAATIRYEHENADVQDLAYCPNNDCPMHHGTMSIKDWEFRPIEDALLARAEKAEARLADYLEDVLAYCPNNDCPIDEVHCGCVPVLRKRIAELEAENKKINSWIDELMNAGNQPRHRNWQDNWDAIVYRIIKEREK
jgi:hypothetical protein